VGWSPGASGGCQRRHLARNHARYSQNGVLRPADHWVIADKDTKASPGGRGDDVLYSSGRTSPLLPDEPCRDNRVVLGFDVTFSAPKSVSALYALGDDDVRAAVVDAHVNAVAAGIGIWKTTPASCAWALRGLTVSLGWGWDCSSTGAGTCLASAKTICRLHTLVAELKPGGAKLRVSISQAAKLLRSLCPVTVVG
jgi:hypothetical protein